MLDLVIGNDVGLNSCDQFTLLKMGISPFHLDWLESIHRSLPPLSCLNSLASFLFSSPDHFLQINFRNNNCHSQLVSLPSRTLQYLLLRMVLHQNEVLLKFLIQCFFFFSSFFLKCHCELRIKSK